MYLVKHHFINKPLTHKNPPHTPTIPCMIVMCQLFVKTIGNLCHALLDTLDVYLFSFLLDISIRYPRCISIAFKNYFEFKKIVACFLLLTFYMRYYLPPIVVVLYTTSYHRTHKYNSYMYGYVNMIAVTRTTQP